MQELIVSLVVAAVSGLTYIAYKHPAGYRRLFWPLMALVIAAFIYYAGYNMGRIKGFYDALGKVAALNKEAKLNLPPGELPSGLLYLGLIGASFYLHFLRELPAILHKDTSNADRT